MKKLTLKFINEGKPFNLPGWTVLKHKAALEKVNSLPKSTSDEIKDIEFQFFCIYESLKEIDSTVAIEKIKGLHPIMLADLFKLVYTAGQCSLYFREKGKKAK